MLDIGELLCRPHEWEMAVERTGEAGLLGWSMLNDLRSVAIEWIRL
jgi:hypothetical protein